MFLHVFFIYCSFSKLFKDLFFCCFTLLIASSTISIFLCTCIICNTCNVSTMTNSDCRMCMAFLICYSLVFPIESKTVRQNLICDQVLFLKKCPISVRTRPKCVFWYLIQTLIVVLFLEILPVTW